MALEAVAPHNPRAMAARCADDDIRRMAHDMLGEHAITAADRRVASAWAPRPLGGY